MNKTLSMTLTVIAVIALAAVVFFAGSMYARANAFGPSMMSGYGWNNNNAYGPSMMNGGGPNMMGGNGGMMNGSTGMGPNMMGGYGYNPTNVTPLTIDQTKAAAEKYMANLDNSDLEVAEKQRLCDRQGNQHGDRRLRVACRPHFADCLP